MQKTEPEEMTSLRFVPRQAPEVLARESSAIVFDDVMAQMIETMPDFVLVLNVQRQIVAVNSALLHTFGVSDPGLLLGKRPGEAVGCIHSDAGPDGCGTGNACFTCGAVGSILEALHHNRQALRECRVTIGTDKQAALDLQVLSTPIEIGGYPYLVCSLRDIAAEKRREVLERVFFHDVINTVGGIRGLAELLISSDTLDPGEERHFKKMMVDLSETLIEEIRQQRELMAAEGGNFEPYMEQVSVVQIMHKLYALYLNHECTVGKTLALDQAPSCSLYIDRHLIQRILGNLLKNALEATPAGGRVAISASESGNLVVFSIKNPGVMSDETKMQLFQRSFSTKGGKGRGIGTYSVKLFGERYLKGKVDFTSEEPEGTIFTFTVSKSGEQVEEKSR